MSSGFSYPQPIFASPIYNPAFYLSLDASGYLTYDYAQTLYLDKNDYRMTYITGITPGTATQGIALVPGTNNDISGIGALSCSSLTVNGSIVSSPPAYVLGITPGTAANNKALVLDGSGAIATISSLTATNIYGSIKTAAQPSITSVGTLSSLTVSGAMNGTLATAAQTAITSVGTLSNLTLSTGGTGLQIPSMKFWNATSSSYDTFNHSAFIGFTYGGAVASKALVVDSTRSISSIGSLSADSLNGSSSVSGTLCDFGSFRCGGTDIITSSRHIQNIGTVTCSGNLNTLSEIQINSVDFVDASRNIYATSLTSSIPSTANFSSTGLVNSYNVILRNPSITSSRFAGMCFHIDTAAISDSTPAASIIAERDSATAFDGANISFWTKGDTVSQYSALTRRLTIMKGGSINFESTVSTDGDLILLRSGANALIRFGTALSSRNSISMQWTYAGSGLITNRLSFDVYGSSNALCITANSRVCVGGSGSESRFHVVGTTDSLYGSWQRVAEFWNSRATPIKVGLVIYDEDSGAVADNGASIGTYTNDSLRFMTNGSNKVEITRGGYLGVGIDPESHIHSTGGCWANSEFHSKANATNGILTWRNATTSYCGIGSYATNPASIRFGTTNASHQFNGYAPCYGGAYSNASDIRYKRDIVDIEYGLAAVMQLKPRSFTWRQTGQRSIGFIAQELNTVLSEPVSIPDDPDTLNDEGLPCNEWSVDYACMVSVLCKAIQEQQAQIDELRAKLATLT
jgi:hypothetical protein